MNVIEQINMNLGKMTKLQKKVADYVIKNPIDVAFSTVDQLAHTTDVSTATVLRLANTLGYTGYTDFQNALKDYLQDKSRPSKKMEVRFHDRNVSKEAEDIAQQLIKNIQETYENLSNEVLDTVVDKVMHARHIYITAGRTSSSMGQFLWYNLNRMYANATYVTANVGEMPELLRNINEEDVVIVMSFARYHKPVIDFSKMAKENGATVIAMTDGYDSPFSTFADHILIANPDSVSFFNSTIALGYLCEVIVSLCAEKSYDIVQENLKASEKYATKLNLMMKD